MDADRRVRFLVAPVLLIASLLWGALLDQNYRQCIFNVLGNINDLSKLIGVAAGGFAVFAFGYVVGTITYFILVVWFRLWGLRPGKSRFYEASLSNDALEKVWVTLHCGAVDDAHKMNKRKQELYAVAAFDHGVLRENYRGVHLWLVRRWSAFNIGATSAVGLGLSFVLGRFNPVIRIPFQPGWWVPVGGLAVILVMVAVCAWRDTMRMLIFISQMTGWWHKEHIRQRAYDLWVRADRPEEKDVEHWQQAEAEIAAELGARLAAGTAKAG